MKKTKKALATLAIAGMTLSMIPFNVFAASTVPTRLAGVTAEQTAVKIADQTGYTGAAILASSTSYGMVDALTAGPLAASLKAPILLTGAGNAIDAATKAELTKLAVKTVYVTSGTAVIKQSVIDELKAMGIEVVALGGYDRAETSVNIAKKMTGVTKVAVANTVVDALSIAAVASAANEPILLTNKDALPASVAAYLASAGVTTSDVIGGTGVISDAVVAGLPSATRHAGMTAYDTNNQVIQDFAAALQFDNVYVASGVTGIDALAGAPLAAQTKSPIVLTDGKSVPAAAAFTYSKSATSTVVTALGGEFVVSESVRLGIAAGQVTPVTNEFKIVSISALDDTNTFLRVDFSKAVTTSLEPSDISIKNAKTLASYGVKTVTLAADGMSAQLELFSNVDNVNVLQYLTDYTVTVQANGTILTANFNRPYSLETRVVDIDVADKEITVVDNKSGASKTLKVLDPNFDYQAVLGELIQVWYNTDNELLKSQLATTTAKYDSIEVTKVDEIKLLTEDNKYDASDEEYANDDDKYAFYLDGESTSPSAIMGDKFNFAKVGFDKSGNVEYVSAYNLKQFLIVDKVDGDEVVGVDGPGTGGSFDAEDATIIKDGKVITLDDLEKGDVLFFSTDADDKDGFAEVYNKTVTGAIDDVYYESITVDGDTYDFVYDQNELTKYDTNYASSAVYIDADGETALVDSDAAEELQAAGDVKLYFDRAGNLVYIAGDLADVESNTLTAILTDDIESGASTYGNAKAQFSVLLENGDEEVYDLTLKDLDTITVDGVDYDIDSTPTATDEWNPTLDVDGNLVLVNSVLDEVKVNFDTTEGKLMEFKLDDNGNVKELGFFSADFKSSTSILEAGDTYLDGKKLLSSTLVFDAKKGYDNSGVLVDVKAGDVSVTKWSDYEGTDISNPDFIINDDNEVIAVVIKTTTTSDTSYEEAVITSIIRNTDKDIVKVTAYVNGVEKTYTVDEVTLATLAKGDVAVLEIDDSSSELVTNIHTSGAEYTGRVIANATTGAAISLADVNVGSREVTIGGQIYKLVSDGEVLDGTDNNDITVETLADLRGKTYVTIVKDELNSNFVKYFMFE